MIGMSSKPSASSAARMAATRPSIMSLGATMSAPASACVTASLASSSSVTSLMTQPPSSRMPQWPWLGVLAHADVGDDVELGIVRLDRADRLLHDAVLVVRLAADLVLALGRPNRMTAGMPSALSSSISAGSMSSESWY